MKVSRISTLVVVFLCKGENTGCVEDHHLFHQPWIISSSTPTVNVLLFFCISKFLTIKYQNFNFFSHLGNFARKVSSCITILPVILFSKLDLWKVFFLSFNIFKSCTSHTKSKGHIAFQIWAQHVIKTRSSGSHLHRGPSESFDLSKFSIVLK